MRDWKFISLVSVGGALVTLFVIWAVYVYINARSRGVTSCAENINPSRDEILGSTPTPTTGVYLYKKSKTGDVFLLVHLRSKHIKQANLIAPPGGSVDSGESFWQGAVRELKEESMSKSTIGDVCKALNSVPGHNISIQRFQNDKTNYLNFFIDVTDQPSIQNMITGPDEQHENEVQPFEQLKRKLDSANVRYESLTHAQSNHVWIKLEDVFYGSKLKDGFLPALRYTMKVLKQNNKV